MGSFVETRVAIVIDDFSGLTNYQTCKNGEFYAKAEEQGTVFTLKGFEDYIYTGEFKALQDSVQHPNYLITRFVDVYENVDEYAAQILNLNRQVYIHEEDDINF